MIYLRNRYYNPETGRFITEDPARDGDNWYVYCANNPTMYVDPSGCIPTVKEAAYSKWFIQNKSNYEITFVGHSKGGGEAAVNAELYNKNAIVFNPSVPNITHSLKDQGYVRSYVVRNEILNHLFGR